MDGMIKRDYRAFETMCTSMATMTASMAYLLGYGYFQMVGLPPSWPPVRFWFPKGELSFQFACIGFANCAAMDLFTHFFLRKAMERHPAPVCYLRSVVPGHFHRSWDMFANYFIHSLTGVILPAYVSMLAFIFAMYQAF